MSSKSKKDPAKKQEKNTQKESAEESPKSSVSQKSTSKQSKSRKDTDKNTSPKKSVKERTPQSAIDRADDKESKKSSTSKKDSKKRSTPNLGFGSKGASFLKKIKNINLSPKKAWHSVKYVFGFSYILTILVSTRCIQFIGNSRICPQSIRNKLADPLNRLYKKLITPYGYDETTINRVNLVELALRNMSYKKSRSFITIGGMAIGIGIIVFLVSIGFGLQDLVISRVARLDELRQADVFVQTGSQLEINDKTLADLENLNGTEKALPLIAVVGRVNYNESVTDVAVYGVTADYLRSSALQPVRGEIYESNDRTVNLPSRSFEEVAGASTKRPVVTIGETIQNVDFLLDEGSWVKVRESASPFSPLLGYTRRTPGVKYGEEVWGQSYVSDDGAGTAGITEQGDDAGRWIKSTFKLWKEEICLESENPDCEENKYVVMRDEADSQVERIGYVGEINMSVTGLGDIELIEDEDGVRGEVLAESTSSASLASDNETATNSASTATDSATPSANLSDLAASELINEYGLTASEAADLGIDQLIATGSGIVDDGKEVEVGEKAVREVIVNRALLNILNIPEEEAVGQEFELSFVIVSNLTEGEDKIRSIPTQYRVVGVDPEASTPFMYVPFIDLRTLGVTNYSQVKLVAADQEALPQVRQQVEVLGYATSSVVDTVEQINSFFRSLRIVLALVGAVALAVAALGMFNTLTVSLLERTREVGLMKAMGMRSYEVQELFLTESMIMGFFGGLLGIILGVAAGELLSVALTAFALTKRAGVIDVSTTPILFIVLTMVFSLAVGLFTGIFPARRATKISALDALRYE